MKLLIPPLPLGVITGVLIWAAAKFITPLAVTFPGQKTIGVLLILGGVLIAVIAVAAFLRSKTTVNPTKPEAASMLVTSGLFNLSRNPMYLSMLGVLIGWSIFLGNLAALALPVLVRLVFDGFPDQAGRKSFDAKIWR